MSFLRGFLCPEDGGDTFSRNKTNAAPHPIRRHSLEFHFLNSVVSRRVGNVTCDIEWGWKQLKFCCASWWSHWRLILVAFRLACICEAHSAQRRWREESILMRKPLPTHTRWYFQSALFGCMMNGSVCSAVAHFEAIAPERTNVQCVKTKTNSVALSPLANYTDWATAICRRNLVPTFVDRGV
jgi:hypothetical protein